MSDVYDRRNQMTQTTLSNLRYRVILVVTAICLLVICYCFWPEQNASATRQLHALLLSTSASIDSQIANLEPFVRIGDHIDDVRQRLSPNPENARRGVKRRTDWSLALKGVSLELAIEADGRVVGIGRHIYGIDDGPFWYVRPRWYQLTADMN